MTTPDHVQSPLATAHRRRRRFLGSAAALTLVMGGVAGATLAEAQRPALALGQPAEMTARSDTASGFADVVARVKPAVVAVLVTRTPTATGGTESRPSALPDADQLPPQVREFMRRFGGEGAEREQGPTQALGSGFFISADGYVVTNQHVVGDATAAKLKLDDGREIDAKVVGRDAKTDLALLKTTDGGGFPFVPLAREAPRVGDWVVAIGNPFGLGGTVTAGIVSARGRDLNANPYDDYLQIDAPINQGNSGGPSFNTRGEVVGVNTAIYSPSGGSVGLGFAIPAATVQAVVNDLETAGKVTRGYLGVQVQPVTKEIGEALRLKDAHGALVDQAEADTPAAKAGLKAGDVIVGVNGEAVADARDLTRRIGALKPGADVQVAYVRDGAERTATVALGTLPGDQANAAGRQEASPARLGLRLAPAPDGQGVVVAGVEPDSPASGKGLQTGDVILQVDGTAVSKPQDVADLVAAARGTGRPAVLMQVRGGQDTTRFVGIALPKSG
ncbi:Do family serine endopeptidase [Salinarimonas soli]|uniref:Probable periplasmic serine endoprotease DegP-like n=1 Tax=Salinarimonas soli TaxID=1638099 RepID=A0A5B2VDV2_9HYPH|nr:Do family serine endopeptidase [Salinarimonas soli]KAA2236602.1 Do family serine endopeptidase [Salinarimonas soli]